ncbi:MAG: FHA domain-containing protein [Thermoguttaceae bacterium]
MDVQLSIFIQGQLRATRTISPPCVIGRSRQADLTIGHPAVSRKHCELFVKKGELMIRDVGSLNGTFAKGKPISGEMMIPSGDSFQIGEMVFVVIYQKVQTNRDTSKPLVNMASDSSSVLSPSSSLDLIDLSNLPLVIPPS